MCDRLLGMQFAVSYIIYSQFIKLFVVALQRLLYIESKRTLKKYVSHLDLEIKKPQSCHFPNIEGLRREWGVWSQALWDWSKYRCHLFSVFWVMILFQTVDSAFHQIGTKLMQSKQ